MSTIHDIYDPPPAPIPWDPPPPQPIKLSAGDFACLGIFGVLLLAAAGWAWSIEPTMALMVLIGGTLVVLESWFTALGFLHRREAHGLRARWSIFFAALIPWLAGLGLATALMLGLFVVSDLSW